MKFISVHHGDQTTDIWASIPRSIIETLRSMGHEVVLINHLLPSSTPLLRLKRLLYRYLFRRSYNDNRDPRLPRARAASLNRRIAALGPADAVLFTFMPDAAFVDTPYPTILIHDSTWANTLNYYNDPADLAHETVIGGIACDTLALQRCTAAIFSSQWAIDSAIRDYSIAPSKLHIAPLGANLDPAPSRDEISACIAARGRTPMKLLFVGQSWERKGGDTAVQICSLIEQRGIPVELHVIGCEPPGDVPHFVHFHGRLDKTIPPQKTAFYNLFRTCDFFLLPTRAEAFGLVFAEAAAFGLPVLTSQTGGVAEVVDPSWSLALPLDAPELEFAAWAVDAYQNRPAYNALCRAARDAFENRLNWQTIGKQIVQLAAAHSPHPPVSPR